MNSTGIVANIALLVILGAFLWGMQSPALGKVRADVLSYQNIVPSKPIDGTNIVQRGTSARYVRILIDGVAYEGTLHENAVSLSGN